MKVQFTWLSRNASCLSLGVALMLPVMALGEGSVAPLTPPPTTGKEFVGPPPPPAEVFRGELVGPPRPPSPPDKANSLDAPRDYLSEQFLDFVTYIDRFFGHDRNYQESNDSVIQIDLIRVAGYGGERKFVPSARASVRLPIAEQKLHLLVETNPDKNPTVDPKLTQSPPLKQPTTPQSYAIALRIEKAEAERWHFSADSGLKLAGLNSSPFVRSRASLAMPLENWRLRMSETVFWFNSTGAGETSQLEFERPISEPVLFRATTIAAWLNTTQRIDFRQDLTLFHKLDDRHAFMYQASAIGVSEPNAVVSDFVILMLYRYRLHRNWMFLEVSPQLHFPKEFNFHKSPMLSMRLEMLLDQTQ